MTLKDKLPDRLKYSPLLTMESDSDIETIAESIVNLSDSDGDFFKKTEKLLLMACLGYLRDWCEPSQRTIGNLISLLDAALPKDNETHTTLDNLFYEMKSGCKRVKSEDGITTLWEPSVLSRCDGLTPRDSNGIDVSEDFSLTCYEGFRHAATRETWKRRMQMANSANPEINKKIATSALGTLFIATVFFYLGDRYAETLVTYPGQIFDHLGDAMLTMWETIGDAPFALDMTSNSLLFGGACFLIIWMIWLRYVAFIGNYRSGEESGSARWGTLKEGKKFKDLQTEDNNLLFTKNFGLALHRPKFDPEYDRNLNVLVVGGSGSGKTFNYVTPNICQLNTSYFVTDPKGTLLKDAGYLFTDNGYKLKSFNTINLDESMHYNPLKYVKTDTDILSFVNCFIMNTNPEGKSSGDPFWENAEKMLYTALIALLRDWFQAKDYNMSSLLTLLSLAEARENDENFKSALDLMFLQIEEGKKYKQNDGSSPDAAGNAGLSRSFGTKQADNGWSWVPSKFKRNSDGVKPADCGGLSADEDFALMNYKNFKVAAGKTLKSILISCNVRLAPIATDGVRELLTYDEMEIDTLGDPDAKVAIFGILSDTDKTLSFLFAILMWQTIDQLCRKALSDYGGKLPTPVHFIFDEFANIGTIPQIEETIAVTRSRNIGITIILQSMSQLESKYDKKAQTIIDCCDSTLFLGGKSNSTNKEIAEMIGKQTIHQMTYNESTGQSSSASKNLQIQGRDLIDAAEIGKMSRLKAILLIAGTNPLMDDKYDPHAHKRYRYIVDKRNWKRLHKNSFDFERYLKNGCEPYTPDEDTGAEFTAWKWAAWKKSRKGLLGILLNR